MLSKKILSASQTAASPPAGDIAFVGVANFEPSSSQDDTPYVTFGSSAIANVQSGDLLIVFISDDLSVPTGTPSGWTEMYNDTDVEGTSTIAAFYKTASSSDTSFTVDGTSNVTFCVPTAVMMAFRNASFDEYAHSPSYDKDDPPTMTTSSGDATVLVLHYQDDNSRGSLSSGDPSSDYTAAGDAFRYASSNASSGTLSWYNLSPDTSESESDLAGVTGDIRVAFVVLNNS